MHIINCVKEDIDEIFRLYDAATKYQKERYKFYWPEFERDMVAYEIAESRQWKLVIDEKIACVWATTFTDPLIWEERNSYPSVYIHRIATNENWRGKNFVINIVEWANKYAVTNEKKFVRLDTTGLNEKLIAHYTKCGFTFLELRKLKNTDGLPAHYHNAEISLFELEV
jgi:GNAT superfamily N-acetyltransferase